MDSAVKFIQENIASKDEESGSISCILVLRITNENCTFEKNSAIVASMLSKTPTAVLKAW